MSPRSAPARPNTRFLLLGAFLLAASGSGGARAESRDLLRALAERWRWRVFDQGEGVGAGPITALYQTVDDYLWVAGERGLFRYDLHFWKPVPGAGEGFGGDPPRRFLESLDHLWCASRTRLWTVGGDGALRRVWPRPQGGSGPLRVAAGRRGDVWLIDEAGRRHYRVREPGPRLEEREGKLPLGAVRDYGIDARGVHWLATDVGLFFLDPEGLPRWREADPFPGSLCRRLLSHRVPPREPLPPGRRLAEGRRVWGIFAPSGEPEAWFLARRSSSGWRRVAGEITGALVESVAVDASGHRWATCDDGRLFCSPAGTDRWVRVDVTGLGRVKLHGVLADSGGGLWFRLGTGGVALFDSRSRRWRRFGGLGDPRPDVSSLLETAGGEVWVGTRSAGVFRYRPAAGAVRDETAGGEGAGIYEDPIHYREAAGRPLERVRAMGEEYRGEESPGRVWIGAGAPSAPPGIFSFDLASGAREFQSLELPVRRIALDERKELWFLPARESGGPAANFVWRRSLASAGRFQRIPILGLAEQEVEDLVSINALARGRDDEVWIGSDAGLLECVLEGERLLVRRWLREEDGLGSRRVRDVVEGPGGAIWACHGEAGAGVTRVAGAEVSRGAVEAGLARAEVRCAVRSGANLWLGTRTGLARHDSQCWYAFGVAGARAHSGLVSALAVPRSPELDGGLLVGTGEQGVLLYRGDDRRKPQVELTRAPERTGTEGDISLEWRARDYKNQTLPRQLVIRWRLDRGPWSTGRNRSGVSFESLPPGPHVFSLEARDLAGFRNWRRVSHRFTVPGARAGWPLVGASLLAGLGGLVLLAALARRLRRRGALSRRCLELWHAHPGALFIVDRAGRVVEYNGRGASALGLAAARREDIVGRPLHLVPAFAQLGVEERLGEVLAGGELRLVGRAASRSGGAERVLEARGFPLGSRGSRAARAAVVVEDVTERREGERLLARERRLRGLRELARRVLGDIESSGRSRELGEEGPRGPGHPDRRLERLRALVDGLSRAAGSSGDGPGGAAARLDQIACEVLREAGVPVRPPGSGAARTAGRVEAEARGPEGLWPARMGRDVAREVLGELVENGIEAMPDGGTLALEWRNLRIEEDPGDLPAGRYVEVTVRDQGPGLDAGQLEAVFDPLWSTKPRDRGAGLGLTVAHGLIRSHGGDIRLRSRPGEGVEARVLLPAADLAGAGSAPSSPPVSSR